MIKPTFAKASNSDRNLGIYSLQFPESDSDIQKLFKMLDSAKQLNVEA